MPGPPQDGDEPDLIRTDFKNLESPEWWKSHALDGVVLYAWGRPKFRNIARAIREAGIFLVLNQDNGGLVSPLAGIGEWWEEQWTLCGGASPAAIRKILRGLTLGLAITDPLRAVHLHHGDVIACVSPGAASFYQTLCGFYGGPSLQRRVRVITHPVEPSFQLDGREKKRQIICVGRWDDVVQKRPHLMMEVIGKMISHDADVRVVIAGNATSEMHGWHRMLAPAARSRVDLAGRLGRAGLAAAMADSQVFYSPSAYESFGIAAAEGLCSGCSVVAEKSVSMVSFDWFTAAHSGTLAADASASAHVAAISAELRAWASGTRDADAIARHWQPLLHADHVAASILHLAPQP